MKTKNNFVRATKISMFFGVLFALAVGSESFAQTAGIVNSEIQTSSRTGGGQKLSADLNQNYFDVFVCNKTRTSHLDDKLRILFVTGFI